MTSGEGEVPLPVEQKDKREQAKEIVDELLVVIRNSQIENRGEILKKVSELYDIVVQQKIEIVTLVETQSKEVVQRLAAEDKATTASTYAEALLKEPRQKTAKRPPDHLLLVYPEEPAENAAGLKQIIEKSIDPNELQITLKEIKEVKGGGILVKTDSEDAIQKLEEVIKSKEELKSLKTRVPIKRRPRIIVLNVPTEKTEADISKALADQQGIDQVIFKHYIPAKEGKHCVLEVTGEDLRKVNKKKISLGWTSYRVEEYIRPTQCFKCYRYGHLKLSCKFEERCGKCSAKGHKFNSCQKKNRCHNCERSNKKLGLNLDKGHSPRDLKCLCRELEVGILKRRTDYG